MSLAASLMDSVEILFAKPLIDEFHCTADACIHLYGGNRTVLRAGAALHTGLIIGYACSLFPDAYYCLRTYLYAGSATGAFFFAE